MKRTIFHIVSLLFLLFCSQGLFAQGNLLVAPIRVVFDDSKQREDLNLSNIGQDTAVYLISFVHYKMLEDGGFQQLSDSTPLPTPRSDTYLRIFPRRVTLAPGESQLVRLQYRKTQNMANGEYRSHLYFRADKDATPLGVEDNKDTTKLSVSITPIFGISIPVIVRNGPTTLSVTLTDVSVKAVNDTLSNLSVGINRAGNMSAYGSLEATYIPETGNQVVVGQANGVGVYTELNKRMYTLPLRIRSAMKGGKLLVRYLTPRDAGGKELARAEIKMP